MNNLIALKIKWQYLAILILGIVAGAIMERSLPPKPVSAKLVTMSNRGLAAPVLTSAGTVKDLMAEQGINPREVFLDSSPDDQVSSGMIVRYRLPLQISVSDGGAKKTLKSYSNTVEELISEQGIKLSAHDKISPQLSSSVFAGQTVIIERITEAEESRLEPIAFKDEVRDDPDGYYGSRSLVREGQAGQKQTLYLVRYKNGVETSKKAISSKVIAEPVSRITKKGSKIVVESYEKGRASWYSFKRCLCAAHPFFPRGSFLRVTNLAGNKSVIVSVNDFGPEQGLFPDRVIDLDAEAFKLLAPLSSGTMDVLVEKLKSE